MSETKRETSTIDDFFSSCADMIFIAAEGGAFLRRSAALSRAVSAELLDADPQAGLALLAHPDDRALLDAAWKRLPTAAAPKTLDLRLKAADGSFKRFRCQARWVPERGEVYGTLYEAEEQLDQEIKLKLLKAINDNLPICLWAIDEHGTFVLHDGKGLEAAQLVPGQFLGLNIFDLYPKESTAGVRETLAGKPLYFVNDANGRNWESWYLPIRNERGEVSHVAGVTFDVTDARRTEADLRAKIDLIQEQQLVIRALSTPIIQVWDRVLTLPLVGLFDSRRAAEVMDSVLAEVVRTRARYAILDLTGIEAMDTETANHLLLLAQALKLLGAEGIITGVSPAVAQAIVGLGLDFTSLVTRSKLREGLQYCIQSMRFAAG